MSFTLINKSFFLFFSFLFICSCSTSSVYQKIKIKKYKVPIADNIDNSKINIINRSDKEINYGSEIILKDFKNDNQYYDNIIIKDDNIYAYTNNKLYNFNSNTGELISSKEINLTDKDDVLISFKYYNNSFILAFKSGNIIRLSINGEILWRHESEKILNTQIVISDQQIILLYVDEIKSLQTNDGTLIWSETYEDLPIYQSKGGQVASFFNIIYFILPNNSIGAIDLNLGKVHNSKYDEIPLVSSLNNARDKIHLFDNYLVYVDEGKYLYTLDIFDDEFILYKKNINLGSSNFIFNNSIILKDGNYIQAINPINGETFWLISDKRISKKSKIISLRNYKTNIELFLSNGDVITINNKELVKINNLDVGKINFISFKKQNIIFYARNGKTIIF